MENSQQVEISNRPGASFPVTDNAGAGGDLAAAGPGALFFCEACLVDKPLDDRSADPRYCQGCCDFLLKEASLFPAKIRPAWMPKISARKVLPIPQDTVLIMSTTNDPIIYSGHNSPPAPLPRPVLKRGPKPRFLPEDLIKDLAARGKGSKAIAGELKKENDITVSYKTVERILKGQRVMI